MGGAKINDTHVSQLVESKDYINILSLTIAVWYAFYILHNKINNILL